MMRRYLLPAALLLALQRLLQLRLAAANATVVTTAPCPQLDGLKCSNLGAPPAVVGRCVDHIPAGLHALQQGTGCAEVGLAEPQ